MAEDLSLLFRIGSRYDGGGVNAARADVAKLKQMFGPELSQSVSIGNKALTEISDNLTNFAAQRVPLVGNAFLTITQTIRGFSSESAKAEKTLQSVAGSIQSISNASGKSVPQITSFLTKFVQLETQSKRNEAAFKFFGGSVDLIGNKTARFLPELEKAGAQLGELSAEAATTGAAIGGMAIPIAIAVAALTALVAGVVLTTRELIELTKRTSDFQGKLFDLAQQTGVTVETLSALEVAARKTGGEIAGVITQSIVNFQRKLEDAQDPLSKTAELFRKFNIDTSDTETALRQTLAALSAMPEGFSQTNAAAELFGARGGKQVLAILKETGGDLDALIQQMREAGILITTDAARSADILNDELALLDFQIRSAGAALAKELIPVLADVVRDLVELLKAIKPFLPIISSLIRLITVPLTGALKGLRIVVKLLALDLRGAIEEFKRINEEAEKARNIEAPVAPGVQPVSLPGTPAPSDAAREATQTADIVIASAKRAANETTQALSEAFERGRIDRQKQAEETIASNALVLDAERKRIASRLALLDQEARAIRQRQDLTEAEKAQQVQAAIAEADKLRQEQLDAESVFETTSREIRARAAKERADSRRNEEQNSLDGLLREFDRQIAAIEAQIKREEITEADGLTVIESIEDAKIEARRKSLEAQKAIGFLTIENQKDFDNQIKQLGDDAAALQDAQIARRLQRERDLAKRTREIKLSEIDTALELQQIVGERTIATIEALAAQRIKTEEDAAKEILRIRLGLIDQEIEATQTKLTAVASIGNVDERVRAEAELNARLKILKEQRKTIESDGNRAIDEGRQTDLENERRYADELRDIRDRIRETLLDNAAEAIRLMRANFASRRDIIRAQTQFELDEETTRHEQALDTLDALAKENRESKKTQEEKLEVEKEINRLREAEAERHRLAMQGIKDQGRRDEAKAGPLGDFKLGTDDLKEFASVIEQTIIPLADILRSTFLQVADAIGQTVANWVLLGETGPAVMRKILAQALASIAAEAAVNAVKMLAVGFANLAFGNFKGAADAFISAGLWASIAGGAALAGRGVAGDLFKQKSGGAGGGAGSGSGSGSRNERDPIDLTRQQQNELHIYFHGEPGPGFKNAVFTSVLDDVRSNGPMRTVIKEVTEG